MLYCGDSLEILKSLDEHSIDAIITDPPFAFTGGISNGSSCNISSQFFSYRWRDVCSELNRILKPEGEGFIWCDWRTAPLFADGFKPKVQLYSQWRLSQMLYHYREMPGQGQPFRSSVDMIAYVRGPKSDGHRISRTTHNWISKYWYYGKHQYHPAEKDPELIEQLIQWCSDEGNIIIDPFMGSGSVGIACNNTKREFIGIEIDPDFFEIAQTRVTSAVTSGVQTRLEIA